MIDNKVIGTTLSNEGAISIAFRALGVPTFGDAVEYIRLLPYGRNINREDFHLVLKEQKGTCSSKHGLLKVLADENHLTEVELLLVIYKMNKGNTPGVGPVLDQYNLSFIPEAHCVLKAENVYIDATSPSSSFERLESDVLHMRPILATDIAHNKPIWHKEYMKLWLEEMGSVRSFDEVWTIREKCIHALSL